MKKIIFTTFLFLLFILTISLLYLSFFGYETSRFNDVIKSEIKKNNEEIVLDFKKISLLLDIKKLTLFVKFINPNLDYKKTSIPLNSLRSDIDLEPILEKKIGIKRLVLSTNYLDINEIKPLVKKEYLNNEALKRITKGEFKIKNLELNFDKNLNIKDNFIVNGKIKNINIQINNKKKIKNLLSNFSYKKNIIDFKNASWSLNGFNKKAVIFNNSEISVKQKNKDYIVSLYLKTKQVGSLLKVPGMNYFFNENNISNIKTSFLFDTKNNIFFDNFEIKDQDNLFRINNLKLNKDFDLINFDEIKIKTSIDNQINNDFSIKNKDKITIDGKVFDAKMLLKLLNQEDKNNILKNISKNIEVDIKTILKGAKFPIKNFRLIGKINKGVIEKISAKSDFYDDQHLDISLKKKKGSNEKILEIYSDIATPLLSDFEFFKGLDGGNLLYLSEYDKKNSFNTLTVNNFKLNNAPALAKLLTLADLKGLTDSLKGEGISFDTLSIKYETNPMTMTINEIFMIGPSISVLIDGYVEKKSGLVSLRGTLVPAKTLNNLVSKIPVVGDILVGKKVGEGIFGLSFKIKGQPDNLKTTVNPVKTLAPRFITRAIEASKKRKSKEQ
tara:strand:- start:4846 stop:6681 length:1836 start_codon:yes stop_codon:yes gene_type:complete